jgi:hypothetical protein
MSSALHRFPNGPRYFSLLDAHAHWGAVSLCGRNCRPFFSPAPGARPPELNLRIGQAAARSLRTPSLILTVSGTKLVKGPRSFASSTAVGVQMDNRTSFRSGSRDHRSFPGATILHGPTLGFANTTA